MALLDPIRQAPGDDARRRVFARSRILTTPLHPPRADGWPEPVRRVTQFLREAGAEARIDRVPSSPAHGRRRGACGGDAPLAARQVHRRRVCDGTPVLAMVSRRPQGQSRQGGRPWGWARLASPPPTASAKLTGFEPGAVAPFPLPWIDRAFLERSLLPLDRVWVGAGSDRHMAGIAPAELVRLARATPRDIAADD
jgi:hypothetical protein